MLSLRDSVHFTFDSIRNHRLRSNLTMLGLTMGVATLITVMTLIQGANVYVEHKIVNLGTDVFQVANVPFVARNFHEMIRALRNKHLNNDDVRAVAERCPHCDFVGAQVVTSVTSRYHDHELQDTQLVGQTASMGNIDSRAILQGRFITEFEEQKALNVCLIGSALQEQLFAGVDPLGRAISVDQQEFKIIGTYEKIGSVLGQDQDNFVVIPLTTYQRLRGTVLSLVVQVKSGGGAVVFQQAMDEARLALRARRHITSDKPEDFYFGTAETYISLWESISVAFFSVFIMVSLISAVVGGIVIMNVMLVSVTERTKEIGIRRALGATKRDILLQFMSESVTQCVIGGFIGTCLGFATALAVKRFTDFPASVQLGVALLGIGLSSGIGLFFGIHPALRAANLDPIEALRTE